IKAAINEPMCKGNGVSLDQALWAYTQGGAIAQGDQGNRGSIAPGRWADFTILNGFFEDLDSVGIYQTLVAGA
ncbi:MAG: amidohydrolase family protein, partial [Deinococcus sp.]|nr:amidohydrolase family protein [Deinococcus sp.]